MREAKIKCLTNRYIIPSLGLVLRKGDEVFLSEEKARQSKELALATRNGAVMVEYVERYKVKKPPSPPPPHVRMSRPGRGGVMRTPEPAPPSPDPTPEKDAEALVQAVQDDLKAELAEIKTLLKDLMSKGVQAPATATKDRQGTKRVKEDEPLFIPDKIVDKSVDIKVSSEESNMDGLDDTVAALKAAKGGTRRRRTKKDVEESNDG